MNRGIYRTVMRALLCVLTSAVVLFGLILPLAGGGGVTLGAVNFSMFKSYDAFAAWMNGGQYYYYIGAILILLVAFVICAVGWHLSRKKKEREEKHVVENPPVNVLVMIGDDDRKISADLTDKNFDLKIISRSDKFEIVGENAEIGGDVSAMREDSVTAEDTDITDTGAVRDKDGEQSAAGEPDGQDAPADAQDLPITQRGIAPESAEIEDVFVQPIDSLDDPLEEEKTDTSAETLKDASEADTGEETDTGEPNEESGSAEGADEAADEAGAEDETEENGVAVEEEENCNGTETPQELSDEELKSAEESEGETPEPFEESGGETDEDEEASEDIVTEDEENEAETDTKNAQNAEEPTAHEVGEQETQNTGEAVITEEPSDETAKEEQAEVDSDRAVITAVLAAGAGDDDKEPMADVIGGSDDSNVVVSALMTGENRSDSDVDLEEVTIDERILKARYKVVELSKRLCRADENIKQYYSELKNCIMSYKGVHCRMSKKFETFTIGRFVVGKMTVRGQVLKLYLALLSDSLENKYYVSDVGGKGTYNKTPTMHNVKSKRGCKYGIELIEDIMEGLELEKNPKYTPHDYAADYPAENLEQMKEGIRHLMKDSITVENCEVISDDEAIDYLVIEKDKAHTINKFLPINKYVIFLGDINDMYADGDKVTIESLIEKGALPQEENIFLEIRGSGTLSHKLYVEAHSFDMTAVKMILLTDGSLLQYK